MPMPTGNRENLTDSERLKTSKTDCALKVYKDKESISLDSRFVDLENTGRRATLRLQDTACLLIFTKILPSFSPCTNQLQRAIEDSTMSTF